MVEDFLRNESVIAVPHVYLKNDEMIRDFILLPLLLSNGSVMCREEFPGFSSEVKVDLKELVCIHMYLCK